ncbi:MAG: hypothetical protein IPM82_25520 [Saprospiraceae bacterium]|nr:hypothetical protein [Saprospiraceae bacterium]
MIGKTVKAGDVLGWAGDTSSRRLWLHEGRRWAEHAPALFAHRDPSDNLWYFFDPYGIYGMPDCYPRRQDGGD